MTEFLGILKLDWVQFLAFMTVVGYVARMLMTRTFVSHNDHTALGNRVSTVERQMEQVVTKTEMASLEARVRPVETGVAVLGSEVQSVKGSVQRTEHMVSLLVEHQMRREGAPAT